jgi:hypothetical protein
MVSWKTYKPNIDVSQLNDGKDVKNILRVMLPKCHTTHTHTHTNMEKELS